MTEYIERDDAVKIAERYGTGDGVVLGRHSGVADCIASEIAGLPAADVAPVVYARWNSMDGYKTRKVCSECGWDVPEYGKFYSYCPNCGAKMDKEEDNDQT